uniref:Uncharacterized protein n=1 Tax=Caenorhabditis tropicalis TaxID=1561998 RepID=A0A1I7UVU7_9PELO
MGPWLIGYSDLSSCLLLLSPFPLVSPLIFSYIHSFSIFFLSFTLFRFHHRDHLVLPSFLSFFFSSSFTTNRPVWCWCSFDRYVPLFLEPRFLLQCDGQEEMKKKEEYFNEMKKKEENSLKKTSPSETNNPRIYFVGLGAFRLA